MKKTAELSDNRIEFKIPRSFLLDRLTLFVAAFASMALTACSGDSSVGTIDRLLAGGTLSPVLTAIPPQDVQQESLLDIDVNNIKKASPGDDQGMSYQCFWDRTIDSTVDSNSAQKCSSLPGLSIDFDSATGRLQWRPSVNELGKYEVKIIGSNQNGSDERVFTVNVRLSFAGLESLTDVRGDRMTLSWTPNSAATGYQIYKRNSSGTFELFQSITGGSQTSVTVTGLTPLQTYSWKVQAVDSLGGLDGNNVSLSAVTADLIRLEVTSASHELSPGQSTTVSVRLKDNGGNYVNVSGLTVSVSMGNTGTSTGTFSPVNDLGNGTYTSTFTATTPGTASFITASLTQYYFVEQTAAMTVSPLQIEITSTATSVNPGQNVTLTARLRDFNGNLISYGGQGLSFSLSGGTSTASISAATDLHNGSFTATLTGQNAGTPATISATLSTTSQIYSSTTITVVPYTVEVTSTLADLSVTRSTTVSARIKDWQGNYILTGGKGLSLVVTGTSGVITLGATSDPGSGTYNATITGLSTGVTTISATLPQSYTVTQTAVVTVRKLRLEVTTSASSLMPGQTATLTGRVKDWQGNVVGVGGHVFDFISSGGSSSVNIGTVTDNGNGTYTTSLGAVASGTSLTITGSISESFQVDTTATITVQKWRLYLSAPSATLPVGQSMNLTLAVKDAADQLATAGGQSVSITQSGGTSAASVASTVDNGDGTYTISLIGGAAGTPITISASIGQSFQVMQTVNLTVEPIHLAVTVTQSQLNPGQTADVFAQVKNASGSDLTTGSYVINFSYATGTSTGSFSSVTSMGNGLYRATFTAAGGGTAVDLRAAANVAYILDSTPTLTVVPWNLVITSGSNSITVGQTTQLTVRIKNYSGSFLTTGGMNVGMSLANSSIGSISSVTDNSDGTYTATFTAGGLGSSLVNANLPSSYSVSAAPTLSVTALHISLSAVQTSLNPGATVSVQAQLKDASGNDITSGSYNINFSASGGTSTGSFGVTSSLGSGLYAASFTGALAGTATTVTATSSVPIVVDQTVNLTVVPWDLIITSSSTSVTVGQTVTITLRIKDASGQFITTGGMSPSLSLGTPGVGSLSAITDNSNGTYTATLLLSSIGSTTVSASLSTSYAISSYPTINITSLHIFLTTSQNSLNPGDGVTVQAQLRDGNGNNLLAGTYSISFTASGGTSTGSFGTTLNLGLGAYSTIFTGNAGGTATTISANASVPFVVDQTVSLTVVPWDIVITSTQTTLAINETTSVTARIKDWQGQYLSSGGKGLAISLATFGTGVVGATSDLGDGRYITTFAAQSIGSVALTASMAQSSQVSSAPTLTVGKVYITVTLGSNLTTASISSGTDILVTATLKNSLGQIVNGTGYSVNFSSSGGTSTISTSSVTEASPGVYQANLQGVLAGTALTISASTPQSYQVSGTASLTVTPSTTISTTLSSLSTSASTVRSGSSITLTTILRDSAGNLVPSLSNVTFHMTTGSGIGTASIGSVSDLGGGQYSALLTGGLQGASPLTVSVSSGAVTVGQTVNITVTSGVASKLTLTVPASVDAGSCSAALSLAFFDSLDNSTTLSSPVSFSVTGVGDGQLFSDASCTAPISTVDVGAGSSQSPSFYYRNYTAGTYPLVFSATGMTQTNSPSLIVIPVLSWLGVSGIVDAYGSGTFYGSGVVDGSFSLPQGISIFNNSGTKYLFVADGNTHSVQKFDITDINAISVVGAIGRVFWNAKGIPTGGTNPSYCTSLSISTGINGGWCTGGQYYSGTGDAQLNSPYRTTVMTISSVNYLFISDTSNNRIVKYNADTGAYLGWTGLIGSISGMSGGCQAAGVGSTTPGWCLGGSASASTASAAISGSASGGSSTGGNQFRGPTYITNDGTYLYVVDNGNNRIVKLDPVTGLLVHWMGRIASTTVGGSNGTTSPTSISCLTSTQSDATSTLAQGQFTPSWCSGGASVSTTLGLGAYTNTLLNPQWGSARSILFVNDGTYNWMLLSDSNHRINRYLCGTGTATPNCASSAAVSISSTSYYPGQFFGWSSWVSAAINTAVVPAAFSSLINSTAGGSTNVSTNGWAYYGTPGGGGAQGQVNSPYGMTANGNYLYLIDTSNQRIQRMDYTTGRFNGWIGRISGTPSSGASGCAGANSGTVTPGWCLGGTGTNGYSLGSFFTPLDIQNDGTYLYVTDRDNFRVVLINMSTGVALGSLGLRVNSLVNNWKSGGYISPSSVSVATSANTSINDRDKIFLSPDQVTTSGNYMYVSDTANARIKRYNRIDGSFQGWIGLTNSQSPTGGDPDCIGALVGGFTPGWCKGGGFTTSSSFGFSSPRGLVSDGTYLYVADSANHRIVRIRLTDGTFSGWIGNISVTPSDGDPGCSTAPPGTATPGWCIGGTAASTASTYVLGGFNTPQGLGGYTDPNDNHFYLIVGDAGNTRLQKIDTTNPSSVWWVGRNSSGSSACGVANGAMVMAWCTTSGVTSSGTDTTTTLNNGYLATTIASVFVDTSTSPAYAYVTSSNSSTGRVLRFNVATGAFDGWIGSFGGTITNANCTNGGTATASTGTPYWCYGGNVTTGTGNGQFSSTVAGIYSDGTFLYISDTSNFRIMKYNLSNGQFQGWVGKVYNPSGLGGGSGCSSAAARTVTPTWCTGGTSMGGFDLDVSKNTSAFDQPRGIIGNGSNLFIVDSANGRIVNMPK